MNIKASVVAAVVVAALGSVSACGSSSGTDASSAPTVPTASGPAAGAPSDSGSSAADPATSAAATSAPKPARTSKPGGGGGTVPDSALLIASDLAAAPSGTWKQATDSGDQKASGIFDADHCDPVPQPQSEDPSYPRNPAWVDQRSVVFQAGANAEVGETVTTYKTDAAASADYTKHKGWVANCAATFVWTDAPAKFAVSSVPLTGVSGAYAIHVGMYAPDQPASTAGSQGYDYMAVILRGKTLTVLDVAQTAVEGPAPKDPGPAAILQDAQFAGDELAWAFEK